MVVRLSPFALSAIGWATFAAATFPVLAIGLNWKGATAMGAIVSITAALSINVIFNVFSIGLPWGVNAGLLAFVTAVVLFIGVSLATNKNNQIDDDIDEMMNI